MWITKMIPGTAPDGAPILSVLAKATYRISLEGLEPLPEEERLPLFDSDKLYGSQNPALDPIEHESDLVAYKPMTDIIVHGEACAPTGKRARFFDMGISVRGCVRKLRIFGPRHLDCSNGKIRFSEPEPFERMPLHFGLAYGGVDRWSHPEEVYTYPRNPVGKGFLVSPLSLIHI